MEGGLLIDLLCGLHRIPGIGDKPMKKKIVTALLTGLISTLTFTALRVKAQQPSSGAAQSKMAQGKGMMSGEMMGQSMMSKHQEMSKLVDQVTADLAALQNEKDLGTMKKKLAADHSLLEQLQTHMQQEKGMMGPMMDRMKMVDRMEPQTPAK